MKKTFMFFLSLCIVFLALVFYPFQRKASVWHTLFRIFQLAEATSPYKRP